MAEVTGKTSAEIDDLLGEVVVSGSITDEGQLLLTQKDGSVVNVGPVGASDSQIGAIVDTHVETLQQQIDDANILAESKATVTVSSAPPSSPQAGDLWYDLATDPPSARIWSGSDWELADANAQAAADHAADIAAGKASVTVGPDVPASAAVGDIWYDTALTPTVTYICETAYASGGSVSNFVKVADPVAQGIANSKAKSTVSDTAPTSPAKGDSWTDTALSVPATFTWDGNLWVATDATAQAIANTKAHSSTGPDAPSVPATGDLWYDTTKTPAQANIYDGTGWVAVDSSAAQGASLAYDLASSRVKATISTDPPTAPQGGDLWYDTSNTPTAAKMWNGDAWVAADAYAQSMAAQAGTIAESKASVTVGAVIPSDPAKGDVWYDTTTTPAAAKIWNGSSWAPADSAAQSAAVDASQLAAGKAEITVSNLAPSSPASGDIWYDTSTTPAAAKVWNGTTWVAADSAAQNTAEQAHDLASVANTLAGQKTKATVDDSAPLSPAIGDMWYDTSIAPAAAKIWTGSAWDAADSKAQDDALLASTLAGTKAKVTVGGAQPASPSAGDMWVDQSTTPYAVKTWTGSAWAAVDAVSQAIAQGKAAVYTQSTVPSHASLNDVWNDTSLTPQVTRICTTAYTNNGSVSSNWAKTVSDAVAQTIANAKNKTTVGNAAPSSPSTGDQWVDITLSPAGVKTWNGTSWVLAGDAAASSVANSKSTVYYQDTAPDPDDNGLWIDTANGNIAKVLTKRKALALVTGGGYHEQTGAASHGWDVTTLVISNPSAIPTREHIAEYDLLIADAGYSSLTNGIPEAVENAWIDGVSIFSTGNDTQSLPPMFTSIGPRVPSGTSYPKTPISPSGTHPVSQGWTEFSDGDANFYLTGLNSDAIVVGTTDVNGTDYPMIVVMEDPETGARWVHNEAYTYTGAFDDAAYLWLKSRWRIAQDQGIVVAQATANTKGRVIYSDYPPVIDDASINLVENPHSASDGIYAWACTNAGGASGSTIAYDSTQDALEVTIASDGTNIGFTTRYGNSTSGSLARPAVTEGAEYYQRFDVMENFADARAIAIDWFNGSASSGSATEIPNTEFLANQWVTFDLSAQVPTGVTNASACVLYGASGSPTPTIPLTGSKRWIRNAFFGLASDVEAYFANDLWIDTTGGANTPKRFIGSSWIAVTDQVAANARDIANGAVNRLDNLSVSDLVVDGSLNVNMEVAGSIVLSEGGGDKRAVIMDPSGITIVDSEGSAGTKLSAVEESTFHGEVVASSISITDGLGLSGQNNDMTPDSILTLEEGVTPAKVGPTATAVWDKTFLEVAMSPGGSPPAQKGLTWLASTSKWIVGKGIEIAAFDADGGFSSDLYNEGSSKYTFGTAVATSDGSVYQSWSSDTLVGFDKIAPGATSRDGVNNIKSRIGQAAGIKVLGTDGTSLYAAEYDDHRGAINFFKLVHNATPTTIQYIPFTSISGWSAVGAAEAPTLNSGGYVQQFSTGSGNAGIKTAEGTSAPWGVTPGVEYTMSAWAATSSGSSTNLRPATIQMLYWDSAGNNIYTYTSSPVTPSGNLTWMSLKISGMAPPGATKVSARIFFSSNADNQVFFVDDFYIYKENIISNTVFASSVPGLTSNSSVLGLYVGNGDFGSFRYVLVANIDGVGTQAIPFNSSGFPQINDMFPVPAGTGGIAYNGSNFYTLQQNVLTKHEATNKWTTENDTWSVGYTWRKSGQLYESAMGKASTIKMSKRAQLSLSIGKNSFPSQSDSWAIYVSRDAAADPARTSYFLQGVFTSTSTKLANVLFSGTNPPDPANLPIPFPLSTPARIAAKSGGFVVNGDSSGAWPYITDPLDERITSLEERISDAATYWWGDASGEATSTFGGWVALTQTPTVINTDDPDNDTFLPISGGIRIYKPGKYSVEMGVNIAGGAANVRMGLGLYTTSDSTHSIPAGGSTAGGPMSGYSLTGVSTNNGNYYTISRTFTIFSTQEIRGHYYCQTTASHGANISMLNVQRVG